MRDIVKKKREEHLKMVWRVNFSHKRLQERMQHMVKFRRQHEQLRTVIVRVLRPTLQSVQASQPLEQQLEAALSKAGSMEKAKNRLQGELEDLQVDVERVSIFFSDFVLK